MEARLQLRLLGTPEASLDGLPALESAPRKAQAALYHLAVTGQPQTRSTLAGLLWGDSPERAARSNLRKVLTQLRRSVGDHLDIDRHTVAFKTDCDCWIDVAAFETKVGDASSNTDIKQLQQAVDLYRADFLSGFYVLHAPDFEAWLLAEQARLRELVVQALYTLAASYTEPDELPQGITYARRLLALEPWREEAHRQLMLLLARDGQRGAALAQYDRCRQALAEELGVEPTAKTTALYEQIREGDLSNGAEGQGGSAEFLSLAPLHPRPPAPPHNLPAQLTPLIGRETALAELADLLADPEQRLVTILGSGGMGKTHLAVEAVQSQVAHFPDGVYLVSLAFLTSPDSMVPAVADVLNISFREGSPPRQQLLDYLRQKQMLLVLDNFEHLLVAPAVSPGAENEAALKGGEFLLIEWLQAAPGLKLLITSRARLNVQGEQAFPIAGLDYPQEAEPVEKAAQFSAIQLFLQKARRVQPGFDLTPDNINHVTRICRWVEGMPLGILLAAAWVELLSPAEIVAEISGGLDFLEADLRDLPERQQSLRAVFDHSWRLLTEKEQRVFRQLSVFRGGFNRQAAQAVTGASLKELRALVNKSLLNRTPGGRYHIHDLLGRYGADKLAANPSQEKLTRSRHSAYYCAFSQQREADLKGARQQGALADIETDSENARIAWEWAVAQGQVNRLEQALESLCLFFEWRGRYVEGEAACHRAAEKLAILPSAASQHLLVRMLTWQSVFSQILGQTERATHLVRQSQTLLDSRDLKRQDTRPEQAFTYLQKGRIVSYTDRKEAKRLFTESLALYRAINDRWGTANALDQLIEVLRLSADYDRANQLQQESLSIRRSLGDQKGILSALCVLALNAAFQGRLDEAERGQQEIQALLPTLNDRISLADGSYTIGRILYLAGQYAESRAWLEESLAIYEELGLRTGAGLFNLGWLSHALIDLGEYEQAFLKAHMELSLGREIGDRDTEAMGLMVLGRAKLGKEKYAEAHQLLQQSFDLMQELGQQKEVGRGWGMLGRAAYGLADTPQAVYCLAEALRIGLKIRAPVVLGVAIPLGALLTADIGNYAWAVELYTLALQDSMLLNSRFEKDVFGRHIDAAAATLPPETVAAARERGQARDMWETAAELLAEIEAGKLSQAKAILEKLV